MGAGRGAGPSVGPFGERVVACMGAGLGCCWGGTREGAIKRVCRGEWAGAGAGSVVCRDDTHCITVGNNGTILATANGWDLETVNRMRNHEQFQNLDRAADLTFHRHQMAGPASVLPWSWIEDCCAIGSPQECATSLQRFIDAGADEVTTYGSTPRQNAALIAAWRERPAARR